MPRRRGLRLEGDAERGDLQDYLTREQLGFGQWLQALSYALSEAREIAIVGDSESADTQAFLSVVRNGYRPFQVVALAEPGIDDVQLARLRQVPSNEASKVGFIAAVPLLQDRGLVKGRAAVYVCEAPVPGRAFTCQAPVVEPEMLRTGLDSR